MVGAFLFGKTGKIRTAGFALAGVLGLTALGYPQDAFTDVPAPAQFDDFLLAVRNRDEVELRKYVDPQERFMIGGHLQPDIASFVYDGSWIRKFNKNGRSVTELLAMGDHKTRSVVQSDGRITFYVIPAKFFSESTGVNFYRRQWMVKYFACEFRESATGYKLVDNFCFAETDGPH